MDTLVAATPPPVSTVFTSSTTWTSVGPFGSQRCGRRPASSSAAAIVPAPSPPMTSTAGRSRAVVVMTIPSPGPGVAPAGSATPIRRAASEPMMNGIAPRKSSGFDRIGRSIAIVSNPRRAATSAPADTSAAPGRSPSTMRALTKSTNPSPLRSCSTSPGEKMATRSAGRGEVCWVLTVAPGAISTITTTAPAARTRRVCRMRAAPRGEVAPPVYLPHLPYLPYQTRRIASSPCWRFFAVRIWPKLEDSALVTCPPLNGAFRLSVPSRLNT